MKPENQNNKKPRGPNQNNNNNNNNKKNMMGLITMILWCLILTLLIRSCVTTQQNVGTIELDYSSIYQLVEEGRVEQIKMESGKYTITFKEGMAPDSTGSTTASEESSEVLDSAFQSLLPTSTTEPTYVMVPPPLYDENLLSFLIANDVSFKTPSVDMSQYYLGLVITSLLPFFLIMGVMYLLFRSMSAKGGFGGMGGVGKSNAKVYVEKSTGVTFANVAGQDEAKESLQEVIDILHNPAKYTEIGAKLPKGALLVGPPGTGKTLLAKAVAGEAGVPFFSISGSDFVEMFVGVGASRVRDLFKEASKMAPCIIFIDEIDTIGKSRDNRMGGGNDEREQTLNQLLAELDGFDPSKGVIVLGATNRPEVLDKALLRPGRFDRRITIDRPNLAGRLTTLQVHTKSIHLAEDVDLNKIALATAGTVGADLANLVNEAALRAVRFGRKAVNQEDLLASFEFVIAGSEKKHSVLTEFEKKLVAYHEVGHAMVAYKQKNSEPVQKITIVPHTEGSLGYTLLMPEEDKTSLRTKEELLAKIAVSMGGRAAEELVLGVQSNGAAQDIQDATGIAKNMVALYGMSEEFGMMALGSVRNQYLDGGYGLDCAESTSAQIDAAVMALLKASYQTAKDVLADNRDDMDKVVAYLLEKETITGAEMVAIIEGRDPTQLTEAYGSTRSQSSSVSLDKTLESDQDDGSSTPPPSSNPSNSSSPSSGYDSYRGEQPSVMPQESHSTPPVAPPTVTSAPPVATPLKLEPQNQEKHPTTNRIWEDQGKNTPPVFQPLTNDTSRSFQEPVERASQPVTPVDVPPILPLTPAVPMEQVPEPFFSGRPLEELPTTLPTPADDFVEFTPQNAFGQEESNPAPLVSPTANQNPENSFREAGEAMAAQFPEFEPVVEESNGKNVDGQISLGDYNREKAKFTLDGESPEEKIDLWGD